MSPLETLDYSKNVVLMFNHKIKGGSWSDCTNCSFDSFDRKSQCFFWLMLRQLEFWFMISCTISAESHSLLSSKERHCLSLHKLVNLYFFFNIHRGWRVYLQDEHGTSVDALDFMIEMWVASFICSKGDLCISLLFFS